MTERLREHDMTAALVVAALLLLPAASTVASAREQHHEGYTIVEMTYQVREQDCPEGRTHCFDPVEGSTDAVHQVRGDTFENTGTQHRVQHAGEEHPESDHDTPFIGPLAVLTGLAAAAIAKRWWM